MAETTRSIAKKAGSAGIERAIQTLMPQLLHRLDRIDEQLGAMDREFHGQIRDLRDHLDTKYEQLQQSVNQLGERMARVEGQLELVVRESSRQANKMDEWIQRLVEVEMIQSGRRKRRAS